MKTIDDLLMRQEVRTCLEKTWQDVFAENTPTKRKFAYCSMEREYLQRIEGQVLPFLPSPHVLTAEDILEVITSAVGHSTSPKADWAIFACMMRDKVSREQAWEPFPLGLIAPCDKYEDYRGSVLWKAKNGAFRVVLWKASEESLFARAYGTASERALEAFSRQAERAAVTAMRTDHLLMAFESQLIDYSDMIPLHCWFGLPYIGDQGDWPQVLPWLQNHLVFALGIKQRGGRILDRLARALQYLVASDLQEDCGPGLALAISAAECLLCNQSDFIRRQFMSHGAVLLEPDPSRWSAAKDALGYFYERRCSFVHGSRFNPVETYWDWLRARVLAGAVMLAVVNAGIQDREDEFYARIDQAEKTRKPIAQEPSPISRFWRDDGLKPSGSHSPK